jgi:hypothetical protein
MANALLPLLVLLHALPFLFPAISGLLRSGLRFAALLLNLLLTLRLVLLLALLLNLLLALGLTLLCGGLLLPFGLSLGALFLGDSLLAGGLAFATGLGFGGGLLALCLLLSGGLALLLFLGSDILLAGARGLLLFGLLWFFSFGLCRLFARGFTAGTLPLGGGLVGFLVLIAARLEGLERGTAFLRTPAACFVLLWIFHGRLNRNRLFVHWPRGLVLSTGLGADFLAHFFALGFVRHIGPAFIDTFLVQSARDVWRTLVFLPILNLRRNDDELIALGAGTQVRMLVDVYVFLLHEIHPSNLAIRLAVHYGEVWPAVIDHIASAVHGDVGDV